MSKAREAGARPPFRMNTLGVGRGHEEHYRKILVDVREFEPTISWGRLVQSS